jgi:hypothetical protein
MWFLKLGLITLFLLIFFQDFKDRKVLWFLYPLVGILVLILQIQKVNLYSTLVNVGCNLSFVLILLFVCNLYAKLKLKKPFLSEVFGLGDVLFFIFISFSFSTISFLILFVFSLFFSLILHQFLKNNHPEETVPLAGYMSLFFGSIYGIGLFYNDNFLYAY